MAKKKQEQENQGLWKDIHEEDFYSEDAATDVSLAEYNKNSMDIYIANVNYSRQFTRLFDGLKPIDSRIVTIYYKDGLRANKKATKSVTAIGDIIKIHPHGDGPIYEAMINNAQFWKKPQPLVSFKGNFGSELKPKKYGSARYTETRLTPYADECFFSDYMEDCIEFIPSSVMSDFKEPMYLPAKFPNGLINGSYGFAIANQGCVPPYNIQDIYNAMIALMKDPTADINMVPEVPTGCDIVDNGTLKDICDSGTGTLRMRGKIDIEAGKWGRTPVWILKIKSFPWMTDFSKIYDQIVALGKAKKMPILELQDHSYPYKDKTDGYDKQHIDLRVLIPYEADPYKARDTLYKNTQLDYSMGVKIQVVTKDLRMLQLSVKDYMLLWLEEKREYKRRLINRKLIKYQEDLSVIRGLLKICDTDKKIRKFLDIVRNTRTDEEIIEKLRTQFDMNSHQASKLYNVGVNKLNLGSLEKWKSEVIRLEKEIESLYKAAKSPKSIDAKIMEDLHDMLKYNKPKKCNLINIDKNQVVSDTNHIIMITHDGFLKKLPADGTGNRSKSLYGYIAPGDYPVHRIEINNLDSLTLFDSKGRFSIIPVSEIPNTTYNEPGVKVYDIAKLEGRIVLAIQYLNDSLLRKLKKSVPKEDFTGFEFVTISSTGMVKRTPSKEIQLNGRAMIKNSPYAKLAEGDEITYVQFLFTNINLLIYTEMGDFSFIPIDTIKSMGKNAMGLRCMPMLENDRVIGCSPVGPLDDSIVVLTQKGYLKRVDSDGLGIKKRKQTSYLATLAEGDKVAFCEAVNSNEWNTVCVGTKNQLHEIPMDKVKVMTRMRMGDKLVPVPVGDNIITMAFSKKEW